MSNKKAGILFQDTPEQKKKLEEVIAAHKDQPGALMPDSSAGRRISTDTFRSRFRPRSLRRWISRLKKYTASLLFIAQFSALPPKDSIKFQYVWALLLCKGLGFDL